MGETEWLILGDVRDGSPKLSAVAERLHDLFTGVTNDDANFGDTGVDHRFDPIEEDRLIGNRDKLLGPSVGDRAKSGSRAAGKNESLHSPEG